MGDFRKILKAKDKLKTSQKEYDTLGKAIEERGSKTIKTPYFSDKKTGELMIDKNKLGKRIPRIKKVYIARRNRMGKSLAGKALLAGAAYYGGKKLIEEYDSTHDKYAGYPGRVADSFSRLVNFTRKSNEVKASGQKAAKQIVTELKRAKPDTNKLGHLNAKKVKEAITAKNERQL